MSNIIDKIQLSGVTYDIGGSGGITSGEVQTMIDSSISGKTNQSDFTGHTANTTVHITAAERTSWNAKSDFSGSYNDLTDKPTIPTVPTSNTAFTNDAGYITDSALDGYATESYVSNGLDGKQDTLESGVNIKTVNNYSLLGSGNINIGGSGGNNVVELTQAEYDALDPKDPSAFYIITDAEGGDLANYMTSAQTTSAIAQAVSGKTDNSDFTGHTADTTVHVTAQDKTNWNAKSNFSGDYNDLTNKLSAGTNITIVDNVISAEGGGGKAVSGGTNISITTGETADTINCTLPIYINQYAGRGDINIGTENNANYDYYRIAIGRRINMSSVQGGGSIAIGVASTSSSQINKCYGGSNVAIGRIFQIGESDSYSDARHRCVVIGNNAKSFINNGVAIGSETTVSGTTKTNINNQLTIDTSNQVYIYNKDNTEMICLQDQLGGGGASYSAGTGIDITNDVISVTGMVATSAVTSAVTSGSTDVLTSGGAYDQLGGLKLVKLTQSEYDNLSTKDNSTLYVIVN